jgi:hypothetical protein
VRTDSAVRYCRDFWTVRPSSRQPAHASLAWAVKTGHLPRRALADSQAPVRTRAAACLLLFAQPVTRIVRLAIDDITDQDGQLLLRLGDPPVPVPEPFAGLLLQLTASRQNTNTATNPASRCLSRPPGRAAPAWGR